MAWFSPEQNILLLSPWELKHHQLWQTSSTSLARHHQIFKTKKVLKLKLDALPVGMSTVMPYHIKTKGQGHGRSLANGLYFQTEYSCQLFILPHFLCLSKSSKTWFQKHMQKRSEEKLTILRISCTRINSLGFLRCLYLDSLQIPTQIFN